MYPFAATWTLGPASVYPSPFDALLLLREEWQEKKKGEKVLFEHWWECWSEYLLLLLCRLSPPNLPILQQEYSQAKPDPPSSEWSNSDGNDQNVLSLFNQGNEILMRPSLSLQMNSCSPFLVCLEQMPYPHHVALQNAMSMPFPKPSNASKPKERRLLMLFVTYHHWSINFS